MILAELYVAPICQQDINVSYNRNMENSVLMLYFSFVCQHTLSGRPGSYPDDEFINKKTKQKKTREGSSRTVFGINV